jgi:inorganic pyrophosphatase
VVSERPIERNEVLLRARVIGGLKLIDRGEADDKIIAVLEGDYVWDNVQEIAQLPPVLVERLEHYFSTYKLVPGEPNKLQISGKYGFDHAREVIEAARLDYLESFGEATQEQQQS